MRNEIGPVLCRVAGGYTWDENESLRPWKRNPFPKYVSLDPSVTDQDLRRWVKNGDEAYEKRDFTAAVEWYYKAAKAGSAAAQYKLGRCWIRA